MRVVAIAAVAALGLGVTSPGEAVEISMGAKGGLSIATVKGTDIRSGEIDKRYGFMGGVFFDFQFDEMISIQPELVYSMKGFSADLDSISGEGSWKLDYLQLPVLLELHISEIPYVDFAIYGGPVIGVNTRSVISVREDDVEVGVDFKNKTEDFEFGLVAGVDLDIPAGPGFIVVDVRFDFGQTSVLKQYGAPDVHTRTIGIMAGYGFVF